MGSSLYMIRTELLWNILPSLALYCIFMIHFFLHPSLFNAYLIGENWMQDHTNSWFRKALPNSTFTTTEWRMAHKEADVVFAFMARSIPGRHLLWYMPLTASMCDCHILLIAFWELISFAFSKTSILFSRCKHKMSCVNLSPMYQGKGVCSI